MTSGEQGRDLLYVDDAIDAFCIAAGRPDLRGSVINIGGGVEYGIIEVADLIATLTGAPRELLHVGAAPARAKEPQHMILCVDRAKDLLGWAPTVGLRDGLERTIAWYRANLAGFTAQPSQ